jgi:hypothetical protein
MKRLLEKGALLITVALSLAALVIPPGASALTWDSVGAHVMTGNLGTSIPALNWGWDCHVVANADVGATREFLTVTSIVLAPCVGTSGSSECALTASVDAGTPDFTVTAASTAAVTINNVRVTFVFTNGSGSCGTPGTVTVTGALNGGSWTAPTHTLDYAAATGLTGHISGLGSFPVTFSGTLSAPTLNLTMT